jgi:hypothetical protein
MVFIRGCLVFVPTLGEHRRWSQSGRKNCVHLDEFGGAATCRQELDPRR